jgi:hypothetical protein
MPRKIWGIFYFHTSCSIIENSKLPPWVSSQTMTQLPGKQVNTFCLYKKTYLLTSGMAPESLPTRFHQNLSTFFQYFSTFLNCFSISSIPSIPLNAIERPLFPVCRGFQRKCRASYPIQCISTIELRALVSEFPKFTYS